MHQQAHSLKDKLVLSNQYFEEICQGADLERIYVAWTGGKDSTVVLYLWRQYLRQHFQETILPQVIIVDTGLKFAEIQEFQRQIRQEWGIRCNIARPEIDLQTYPIAQDPIQCCSDLKIHPLKEKMRQLGAQYLLTGVRADEHPSRQDRLWKEPRHDPDYIQINPIMHWTEMDVWSFHMEQGISYCSLYDQGYRSLGCRPCTHQSYGQERAGRNQEKESNLELLRSLGYF
jgi:phosphoadenosine phosphosulfate reductase